MSNTSDSSKFYANLVHVTRCSNCKHFKKCEGDKSMCDKYNSEMTEFDFCSNAVPKKAFSEPEYV